MQTIRYALLIVFLIATKLSFGQNLTQIPILSGSDTLTCFTDKDERVIIQVLIKGSLIDSIRKEQSQTISFQDSAIKAKDRQLNAIRGQVEALNSQSLNCELLNRTYRGEIKGLQSDRKKLKVQRNLLGIIIVAVLGVFVIT